MADNVRLAYRAASVVWQRNGGDKGLNTFGIDRAEYESEIMYVLWRCAAGYKPELGWTFSTYAYRALLQRGQQVIDTERGRKRCIRAHQLDTLKTSRKVVKHNPTLDQVLANECAGRREALYAEVLRILDDRTRRIVLGYYAEKKTLQEIATAEGVTRERIRQILITAIARFGGTHRKISRVAA